jgi:agmatine deiminase
MAKPQKEPAVRLPAEWEPQAAVLMAWPHPGTDWAPVLEPVVSTYCEIIRAIADRERVILAAPEPAPALERLKTAGCNLDRVAVFGVPTNDTWARDFGPITVRENGRLRMLKFTFNGWGSKFKADDDDRIVPRLAKLGAFGKPDVRVVDMILEGGSIDSDGAGGLLTTSACLLNPNRNESITRTEVEESLGQALGTTRVLWLEHGYLAGDDTDSHVDVLARFAPGNVIVYTACDDLDDEHFTDLTIMEAELSAFGAPNGEPYQLLPLPWPAPILDDSGRRLPASYANFLVINGAVLVPVYGDPKDEQALAVVAKAFPGREVKGIDCRSLISQHGSLHCVTMQIPREEEV